jgi:hypothetical protein
VPRNEFLCTQRNYTNFVLRLKFKLTGRSGFINGGVRMSEQEEWERGSLGSSSHEGAS